MKIVWDEPKRIADLAKHGLDFFDLDVRFFINSIIRPGHSGRLLALGRRDDDVAVAVVFRALGAEALSVVSMRGADVQERRLIDAKEPI